MGQEEAVRHKQFVELHNYMMLAWIHYPCRIDIPKVTFLAQCQRGDWYCLDMGIMQELGDIAQSGDWSWPNGRFEAIVEAQLFWLLAIIVVLLSGFINIQRRTGYLQRSNTVPISWETDWRLRTTSRVTE